MWNYKNELEALNDVLRLSRGMTFKASIAVNFKLDLLNLNVMKDWESSLEEYINILKVKE